VREALHPEGCGWALLPLDVSDEVVTTVCDGAYGAAAEAAPPIINSQLHARMPELGDSADRGRRQVPVASQGGSIKGAVRQVLGAVASRVGNDLHAAYDVVTRTSSSRCPVHPRGRRTRTLGFTPWRGLPPSY